MLIVALGDIVQWAWGKCVPRGGPMGVQPLSLFRLFRVPKSVKNHVPCPLPDTSAVSSWTQQQWLWSFSPCEIRGNGFQSHRTWAQQGQQTWQRWGSCAPCLYSGWQGAPGGSRQGGRTCPLLRSMTTAEKEGLPSPPQSASDNSSSGLGRGKMGGERRGCAVKHWGGCQKQGEILTCLGTKSPCSLACPPWGGGESIGTAAHVVSLPLPSYTTLPPPPPNPASASVVSVKSVKFQNKGTKSNYFGLGEMKHTFWLLFFLCPSFHRFHRLS